MGTKNSAEQKIKKKIYEKKLEKVNIIEERYLLMTQLEKITGQKVERKGYIEGNSDYNSYDNQNNNCNVNFNDNVKPNGNANPHENIECYMSDLSIIRNNKERINRRENSSNEIMIILAEPHESMINNNDFWKIRKMLEEGRREQIVDDIRYMPVIKPSKVSQYIGQPSESDYEYEL